MGPATRSYDRAPSDDLKDALSRGGSLETMVALKECRVERLPLDVHLRANDEVHVYCGLARLMRVRRLRSGAIRVSAHKTFSEQPCAGGLIREWDGRDAREFKQAVRAYLKGVKVRPRHTEREGDVQSLWSRVTDPWIPFDREAVLGGRRPGSKEVGEARKALEEIVAGKDGSRRRRERWSSPPAGAREVDQLAIDSDGRLVLLELKAASSRAPSLYYAPFQLLHSVWEWHEAIECVRDGLQQLLDARVALKLTPDSVPRLTRGHPRCGVSRRGYHDRRREGPLRDGVGGGEQAPPPQRSTD